MFLQLSFQSSEQHWPKAGSMYSIPRPTSTDLFQQLMPSALYNFARVLDKPSTITKYAEYALLYKLGSNMYDLAHLLFNILHIMELPWEVSQQLAYATLGVLWMVDMAAENINNAKMLEDPAKTTCRLAHSMLRSSEGYMEAERHKKVCN